MSESFSAADKAVIDTSKCLQDITNTLVKYEEHHPSTPYNKCMLSDDEDVVDIRVKPIVDECVRYVTTGYISNLLKCLLSHLSTAL